MTFLSDVLAVAPLLRRVGVPQMLAAVHKQCREHLLKNSWLIPHPQTCLDRMGRLFLPYCGQGTNDIYKAADSKKEGWKCENQLYQIMGGGNLTDVHVYEIFILFLSSYYYEIYHAFFLLCRYWFWIRTCFLTYLL